MIELVNGPGLNFWRGQSLAPVSRSAVMAESLMRVNQS